MPRGRTLLAIAIALAGAFYAGRALEAQPGSEKPATRVFEIRTYTANEGKLDDLHARFRDHTMRIFEKHGMTNIGYWVPIDEPRSQNTLIYIIAHESRDAAKANWAAFQKDPEWQKVRAASEENGKLVAKVDSVFATPTDYSPVK
jgi:hypothetical protein